MLKLYSSLTFLIFTITLSAQTKSEEVKTDTVKSKFLPTGVRIGTDAFSIARNFYDESFTGWEVNADVDFYRYYLALDVGSWSRKFSSDAGPYENDGTYWRAGFDINFLLKDPDRNLMFFGMRYGRSVFTEKFDVETVDPVWGSFTTTYINSDVSARWYELTAGIRVKIWRMFWMGYTGRFKFSLKTDESGVMLPSDVPGYGRTNRDETWGFNYQLIFRIPIRKAPSGPLKQ